MARFGYKQVSAALNAVLEEHGEDAVNPDRRYVNDDGSPCCVVGNVIAKLDPALLVDLAPANHTSFDVVRARGNLPPTLFAPAVWDALGQAQWVADNGYDHTWGTARKEFDAEYRAQAFGAGRSHA